MARKITFEICGDTFSPNQFGFNFNEQNEPQELVAIGKENKIDCDFGTATYIVPKNIPRADQFKHLADLFEPLLPDLEKAGAEQWYICIHRLYDEQCNEELDFNDITQIARLKCSLSYSAHRVPSENKEYIIE